MHGFATTIDGDVRPIGKRYRVTARGSVDARTRPGRRRRELEVLYRAQVHHKLTKFEQAKVRRCASLATLVEVIETGLLSGDDRGRSFVPDDLVRCTSALRRAEKDLFGPGPRHSRQLVRIT